MYNKTQQYNEALQSGIPCGSQTLNPTTTIQQTNPIQQDLEDLRRRIARVNNRLARVISTIHVLPGLDQSAKEPGAPDIRTTLDQCSSGMYLAESILSDIERELIGSDRGEGCPEEVGCDSKSTARGR